LPLNQRLQQIPETLNQFYITGWGETENGYLTSVLTEATVSNLNRSICQQMLNKNITPGQLCAGDFGTDSCRGDSGGSLSYVTNEYNGSQRFGLAL